jgi:AmmeMemoRadiSam system protein A
MDLTQEEKIFLLKLARQAIITKEENKPLDLSRPPQPLYEKKLGAFVTLHKKGRLRGCIGYIEGIKNLYDTIIEMAQAAAFKDHRFGPVTATEIPELEIEISVLSPLHEIDDPKQIVVGQHGIVISNGYYSGILLPQVAIEQNWDRQQFLEHTCLKAGLPRNAYQDPNTHIKIFSATIFNENDLS